LFSSKGIFFFLVIPSKAHEFLPNASKSSVLIKKVLDTFDLIGHSLKNVTDWRHYAIDSTVFGF